MRSLTGSGLGSASFLFRSIRLHLSRLLRPGFVQQPLELLGQGLGHALGALLGVEVVGDADGLPHALKGLFHDRAVLALAQDDGDGGRVLRMPHPVVEHGQLGGYLRGGCYGASALMGRK